MDENETNAPDSIERTFHMEILEHEGFLRLRFRGSFDEYAMDWFDIIATRLGKVPMDVVLNLEEVKYIDSAGLGILFAMHKQLKERRCTLCFAMPSEHVRDIFEVAGLDQVLPLYESEEEALAALRG